MSAERLGPGDVLAGAVEQLGLPGLLVARADARRLVEEDGVRYTPGPRTDWVIDPLPLVVPSAEWGALERGLEQRARLLDALLKDLYGERRTLREGLIPAELIGSARDFLAQAQGARLPGGQQLVLTGTDVARVGTDWVVVGDRSAVPSGAGYAMVNRRIVSRALAKVHRGTRLRRLRGFFDTVRLTLDGLSPLQDRQPKAALLWPGAESAGAYEMGFLAAILGTSLVSGSDLIVRDGRLYIDAPDRQARIDVLVRRIASVDSDSLEVGGLGLGTAGLMEAARSGRLSVANPLGADILDSPGLVPYLPGVARALLGEDLLLGSADTFWCGNPASRSHVLSNLASLIVRPAHRGTSDSIQAWQLTEAERVSLAERIDAEPWAWVGQDPLFASTAPIVTGTGLVHRRVLLRTFGVAAPEGYRIMPGGLARVSRDERALKVSTRGVLAKDVWVLDDTVRPAQGAEAAPLTLASIAVQATAARTLAPRVADNLYWFGRYTERLDATARLLRQAIDLSEDFADRPDTMGFAVYTEISRTLWALHGLTLASTDDDPGVARAALRRTSVDPTVTGGLAQCFEGLQRCAYELPTVMSGDVWHILAAIRRRLDALAEDPSDFQSGLLDIRQSTLALFGVAAESLMKDNSWALIDAGVRMERAVRTMQLITTVFAAPRPLMVLSRLSDVVMESCDSQITHRRRSLAGVGPNDPVNACAALLVLERENPRAVVPQLERFADDMDLLDDDHLAERVRTLVAALERSQTALTEGNVGSVSGVLSDAVAMASDIKDELKAHHFTRPAPQHAQQVDWSNGRPPALLQWSARL